MASARPVGPHPAPHLSLHKDADLMCALLLISLPLTLLAPHCFITSCFHVYDLVGRCEKSFHCCLRPQQMAITYSDAGGGGGGSSSSSSRKVVVVKPTRSRTLHQSRGGQGRDSAVWEAQAVTHGTALSCMNGSGPSRSDAGARCWSHAGADRSIHCRPGRSLARSLVSLGTRGIDSAPDTSCRSALRIICSAANIIRR